MDLGGHAGVQREAADLAGIGTHCIRIGRQRLQRRHRAPDVRTGGFAGGHGAAWDFPDSPAVKQQARALWEQGGVVAAVCHGPTARVNVSLSDGTHLVAGKNVVACTDDEERAATLDTVVPLPLATTLTQRGAIHHAAPNRTANTIADGRLVIGQNPPSARGVGEAVRDLVLTGR